MAKTVEDLINMIPRVQSGDDEGRPTTATLRAIERRLRSYSHSNLELAIIEAEIVEASRERFNRP